MKKLLLIIPVLLLLTMECGLAGMVNCPGKYIYTCCAVLDGQGKPTGRVEHYRRTDNSCPSGGYRSIPCTPAEAAESSKVQGVECAVKG